MSYYLTLHNVSLSINHFNIYFHYLLLIVLGECPVNYTLVVSSEHQLISECTVIGVHPTDVTPEGCKYLACQQSANTFNYRKGSCTLLDCEGKISEIKPSTDGWNIYQQAGMLSDTVGTIHYFSTLIKLHKIQIRTHDVRLYK